MQLISEQLKVTQHASRTLVDLSEEKINAVLLDLAESISDHANNILAENKKDLDNMDVNDPTYDRLMLNKERLEGIANDMRSVAGLAYPVGIVLEKRTLVSGLELSKVTVPLGVVGIIYEARPNVTFDVFSLCFKSGNACVLKGGSDAEHSNAAIVGLIHTVLEKHGIDPAIVLLLPAERSAVTALLGARGLVDVIIPRGGQKLIDFVRDNATVPVIETGAGIVHTYVDETADTSMAAKIIFNAKTRRVSVCNALDTLIIHEDQLKNLPAIIGNLQEKNVEIFADEQAFDVLKEAYPSSLLAHATDEHFGTEFLDYKLSIKTVHNLQEAIDHIGVYSSKHTEAIISKSQEHIDYFTRHVDAGVVLSNASTAFTDGGEFGLGAEIGTSTQKLHARGPMGLSAMTSYKWIIVGHGEVRDT